MLYCLPASRKFLEAMTINEHSDNCDSDSLDSTLNLGFGARNFFSTHFLKNEFCEVIYRYIRALLLLRHCLNLRRRRVSSFYSSHVTYRRNVCHQRDVMKLRAMSKKHQSPPVRSPSFVDVYPFQQNREARFCVAWIIT
jgi:hypothetical protein